MKPAILIAVVFGAVIAGGAGGYVAAQLSAPAQTAPAPTVAHAGHEGEHEDLRPDLDVLRAEFRDTTQRLSLRLNEAEKKAAEADALAAKVRTLTAQIEALGQSPTGAPGAAPAVSPEDPAWKEAVEAAIIEREQKREAEREAEQQKRIEEFRANATRRALDTLTERLALTADQVPKVKAVLDDFSAKRREIFEKGREAGRNNQQFDWQAESAVVNTAATDAVKVLLSSAQLTTFNELVGDRGLRAVTDQGWGGGMPGAGRPRGNRGGNNND